MSDTKKSNDSSLLWDCFTNWSLTLEKTTGKKLQRERPRNENNPKDP
ncbi:MAG TPA: hypothetical protein VK536_08715 [Candidatus Limnocylindrales bacterium]|nr:hypothetical protein [Candidatus Limnocylindrales bacterium]